MYIKNTPVKFRLTSSAIARIRTFELISLINYISLYPFVSTLMGGSQSGLDIPGSNLKMYITMTSYNDDGRDSAFLTIIRRASNKFHSHLHFYIRPQLHSGSLPVRTRSLPVVFCWWMQLPFLEQQTVVFPFIGAWYQVPGTGTLRVWHWVPVTGPVPVTPSRPNQVLTMVLVPWKVR